MQWLPRSELLTFEEIERIVRIGVERLGIRTLRLTGGEPTVRSHLPVLIERLAALRSIDVPGGGLGDIAMTTNGATLGLVADDLAGAGLTRVNVSLDTLHEDRFVAITGRDRLHQVLEGIDAAVAAGLNPVKVNCVVVRGVNDDEVADLAAFGRDRGVSVRFIEVMPLDAQHGWGPDKVVAKTEILDAIDERFPLAPEAADRGHAPASIRRFADGHPGPGGEVGVVASVTESFCASCDRVRLTADGAFRSCLFALDETDLRGLLRGGADDAVIEAAMRSTVDAKWAGHQIGNVTFLQPKRAMSQIGG